MGKRDSLQLLRKPEGYVVVSSLARWLREAKDYPGAVAAYRASLPLIPKEMTEEQAATHTLIGMTLDLMGDRENAQKELVTGARLAPDEPVVYSQLGSFLFKHGRYREAEEILEGYPDLEREDIQQAIEYAAWLAQEQVYSL